MSKRRMIPMVIIIITFFYSTTVYANSSWYWISTTRPYDVLPYVAAITLAAETLAVNYICHIRRPVKVFLVMLLGNLVSFFIPYIGASLDPVFHIPGHPWQSVLMYAESLPFYTVGAFYLLLTIAAELPIEYGLLRKSAGDSRRLLYTIVGANTATTIFVAVTERIFCHGHW